MPGQAEGKSKQVWTYLSVGVWMFICHWKCCWALPVALSIHYLASKETNPPRVGVETALRTRPRWSLGVGQPPP